MLTFGPRPLYFQNLFLYEPPVEPPFGERDLLEVVIQDNESLDRALRRFKRKVQRSGLYSELRKRRFYEKPSAQRKRKREAAIRRERRRQRRTVRR